MTLEGTRIALLIEDDFQEMEAWYPYMRLIEEGATVIVIGPEKRTYHSKLGYEMEADAPIGQVSAADFDGVIVPGGFAPDHMRLCRPMVDLVGEIFRSGKLTAAICHGGWILASAGVVKGKKIAGYTPIKDDVENAGGTWVDAEVVEDGNVITSRTPPDLPAFARSIVAYLGAAASHRRSA